MLIATGDGSSRHQRRWVRPVRSCAASDSVAAR
jgi:hypothetical protein